MAFNQEEFDKLIEDRKNQIYLFGNFFELKNAAKIHNTQFVGVLKTMLKINTDRFINFYKHGVTFKNIRFDEAFYKVKNIQVGDTILLGKWQGFDVEWKIIEKNSDQGEALLLSTEPLHVVDNIFENGWGTHFYLRNWLNGSEFYEKVFSDIPKGVILSKEYGTQEEKIVDKVFLLDADQLCKYYLRDSQILKCPDVFKSFLQNELEGKKEIGKVKILLRDYNKSNCDDYPYAKEIIGGIENNDGENGKEVGVVIPACWIDTNSAAFYEASCKSPSMLTSSIAIVNQGCQKILSVGRKK